MLSLSDDLPRRSIAFLNGRDSRHKLEDVYERLKFSLNFLRIDNDRDSLVYPLLAADIRQDLK